MSVFVNNVNKSDDMPVETIKIKVKSEPIISDKNKILRTLENLEMETIDTEKDARIDVSKCNPSKLFNLIARSSFYRAMTGCAEELYPEDLDIQEHVKSAKNLLTEKALTLASKFEKDCECKNIK